jgi:glutathione S-transferase
MSVATPRPKMLTFQPMVDSETTRLICRYYGIDFEEHDHLFPWVSVVTLFRGGTGYIPLLTGKGFKLTGPWPVVQHFDPTLPPERRLVPPGPQPLADEVMADWKTFNGGMGADVAVFSYFHLLPERALMERIFAEPVPPMEAKLVPSLYGLMCVLFNKLLKLSPERAAWAADRMRRDFEATDRRIADGRPYLCGDRLTAGDLALCAASAPLLLPRGYTVAMPSFDEFPPVMQGLAAELRAHPTAAFVQRLYRRLTKLVDCGVVSPPPWLGEDRGGPFAIDTIAKKGARRTARYGTPLVRSEPHASTDPEIAPDRVEIDRVGRELCLWGDRRIAIE